MAVELVVCVATELEGALLRPHVPLLVTGVGAVNAAIALTRYLERDGAHAVVVCGIAGAYPRAFSETLPTGSVVCAQSECYGDLGANSSAGFLNLRDLGFPLIAGTQLVYNELPLQLYPAAQRARFMTVNTCTGTDEDAHLLEKRFDCSVESMEGAAVAHVAALYGIPAGEIRGISNRAGNRDRATWKVRDAAVAAQQTLIEWLSVRPA